MTEAGFYRTCVEGLTGPDGMVIGFNLKDSHEAEPVFELRSSRLWELRTSGRALDPSRPFQHPVKIFLDAGPNIYRTS